MSQPKDLKPYSIGWKIRRYREKKEWNQKELSLVSGVKESTIRHYELGNTQPSEKQLEQIAGALKINYYALANISYENPISTMHALFELEERYEVNTIQINKSNTVLGDYIQEWTSEKEKLKANEITQEEYEEWKAEFPQGYKFK